METNSSMRDLKGKSSVLTMTQPAGWWRDAFPLGNGCLGAMPYGRLYDERVLLNHERLWYAGIRPELPELSGLLQECRQLIDAGKSLEANELYTGALQTQGRPGQCARYHPAADLRLRATCESRFRDYSRELDLSRGLSQTLWTCEGAPQQRDCFVSRADDCVVLRQVGSEVVQRDWRLNLEMHEFADALTAEGDRMEPPIDFEASAGGAWLIARARYTDPAYAGAEYGLVAKVSTQGPNARIHADADGSLVVSGAERFTVVTKVFVYEDAAPAVERLKAEVEALTADFDLLLERHIALHQPRFEACRVDLTGDADAGATSNERLLLDAYSGDMPLELLQKMTDYGRYLLIASSSRDSVPSNLQGIWNGDYAPPWDCFLMINENLLMNYWQALPGGLDEEVLGVFNFFASNLDDYRENAKRLYGCRGIFIPALSSPETGLLAHAGSWIANWISGAGWLCQLFYDYYLFTGDEAFLRERLLPFMREVALFYEDYFTFDASGQVVISPSTSPENWPKEACGIESPTAIHPRLTVNATMDVAIAKELLGNLLRHAQELSVYAEHWEHWECMHAGLPAYSVNEDGAIREWLDPRFSDNYEHRHLSHIYPVFPGFEVDAQSHPNLFPAFKVAVEKRATVGLKDQTGWSFAHMANIHARMGEGEAAMECLETMAQTCVGKNLFTYHNDYRGSGITINWSFGRSAPFQIDANMGLTAAVYEMLVQSVPGLIRLLPALPERLGRGSAHGLRTRTGVTMDLEWQLQPFILKARFHSSTNQTIQVHLPTARLAPQGLEKLELELKAGQTLEQTWNPENTKAFIHS